ncbi:MAG: ubiquitin carboxyl-terminal hydrolase [Amphiamblys sp. WSBS2006]|nr:MAG: ubiquitin carboxyl-terminal hydrolase [Amphiamblys sp. WSBS2006]
MFSKKKIVLICAVVLVVLGTSIFGIVYAVKQKQKEKPSSDTGKEKKTEGTGTAEEPSSDRNNPPDVVSDGLPNLGNTCYANTVFQTLYHIQPLREFVKKKNNKPVLKELDDLFLSMEKKDGEREKERKLENIKRVIGDIFKTEMRDAVEFMREVFGEIEKNLEGPKIPKSGDYKELEKIFYSRTDENNICFVTREGKSVQEVLEKQQSTPKTSEVLILSIESMLGREYETSKEITREGIEYSLSQVCVFTGKDYDGHYHLLVKTESNPWKEFSDMRERSVGEGEVFGISPNHTMNKAAGSKTVRYLVYTKNSA